MNADVLLAGQLEGQAGPLPVRTRSGRIIRAPSTYGDEDLIFDHWWHRIKAERARVTEEQDYIDSSDDDSVYELKDTEND